MNILYVEDDPFDADLTVRALSKSAPHIMLDIARTQNEAMARLSGDAVYDLMLTDLRLPDGSGFALLSQVRENGMPMAVVVITGQGDEEIAVSVLKAGADDYLVKRQDYLDQLAITLENALQRYRAEVARKERPLRVLYLEDNPSDAEVTRRHFASHAPHIHLDVVHSESEIFRRLPGKNTPTEHQLLMVDYYQWSNLNPLDLLKELRQVRNVDIPIVLVTGRGDEEIAAQALRLGASDYVVKSPGYLYRLPGLLENAHHRAQLLKEQAALLASEERYRRLAENAPDIIYRYHIEPEPGFEYVSPAVHQFFGCAPSEFYADPNILLRAIHADDQPLYRAVFEGKYPAGEPWVIRYIHKNGRMLWVEGRNVPLYDEENRLVAHEGIIRDITERKKAEEHIQRQFQRLNALRMIDTAITASLDLRVTLNVLLEHVTAQLGTHAADVMLFDGVSQTLKHSAALGFRSRIIEQAKWRLGEGPAGRAAMERRTIQIQEHALANQTSRFAALFPGEGFVSYIGTPLIAKGQVKGVLEVYNRRPLEPDSEWLSFFETLAGQAAIAIDNAEMFENVQLANQDLTLAYDTTLEGWVRALDLRDKETQGHTQRVTEITLRLAKVMGIGEDSLAHIRRGTLLHDIGKMGIPDSILHKPGPLTAEEWETMRRHPTYAYDLLWPIEYLRPALDIPYCHHERWDGTGYPQGLQGEQIPLAARIFTVVDVWDALSSDRPYRESWDQPRVFAYIRSQSGSHFDPNVVATFIKLMEVGQ